MYSITATERRGHFSPLFIDEIGDTGRTRRGLCFSPKIFLEQAWHPVVSIIFFLSSMPTVAPLTAAAPRSVAEPRDRFALERNMEVCEPGIIYAHIACRFLLTGNAMGRHRYKNRRGMATGLGLSCTRRDSQCASAPVPLSPGVLIPNRTQDFNIDVQLIMAIYCIMLTDTYERDKLAQAEFTDPS
jgi:hypothetical protein